MGLSTKQTTHSSTTTDSISASQSQVQLHDDDDGFNLEDEDKDEEDLDDGDDEHCVICLHEIRDRTILPCAHDRLCFECIFVWCQQSRKCPLCNAPIGPYLIHNFRSDYDYSKHYLQPLRISPVPSNVPPVPSRRSGAAAAATATRSLRNREPVQWGRRRNAQTSQERKDELELAISKRRWIYRHGLYAMHVASNSHTRYRPAPTPAQFSNSQDAISRATIFIRRELRVWINLDVEFLTTFILSLMKSIDIRSESAVKLLAEFLDMDISYHVGETDGPSRGRFPNAEHFAHELYSYLRSPFKDLTIYDRAVQYEIPSDIPPPPDRPIPKRYERHWETTHDTAAAESSSRHTLHRPRSHSHSHSPHLRSEEEEEEEELAQHTYSPSPSPSPSNSYDDNFYRYRSSRVSSPGGGIGNSRLRNGPGPSSSGRRRDNDDDSKEENNKNGKGKGKGKMKEIVISSSKEGKHESDMRVRGGTWKSKSKNTRVDSHHHYQYFRTGSRNRKRERSVSSEYSTRKRSRSRSKSPFRRNVGHELSQRRQEQNDIPANITEHVDERTTSIGTSSKQREILAPPPPSTIITITDQQPEVPVHPNWGISIKGQAKLQLGGGGGDGGGVDKVKRKEDEDDTHQLLSGSSRALPSVEDEVVSKDDTISKSRLFRKPSELLLHAHLLRNSSTAASVIRRRTVNEVDASNSGGSSRSGFGFGSDSGSGSGSGSSSATVRDIQNNYNNNNKGINSKEENERRRSSPSPPSRDLEVAPRQAETQDGTTTTTTRRMSARDIMIRTRARLAKLRNEQDSDLPTDAVVAVMEESSAATAAALPPPSNTISELRPTAGTQNPIAVSLSATVRAHLLKQLEEEKRKLNRRNSGNDVVEAGGGMANNNKNTASDGHTGGGISIGKDHQDLITKEEILRARLLSRKKRNTG